MRQRELEIRLERVPDHPTPDPNLEQYRTPAPIAADLLYRALARGDVVDKRIVDLGCGSGIFLVGAALLGAQQVTGVEIDPTAAALARKTLEEFNVEGTIIEGRADDITGTFDTALMNPPFGAQHAHRHADSTFVQHALRVAPVCYSLHMAETAPHIERLARSLEADLETLARYQFPIPARFRFHTKEKILVPVLLYRFQRMGTD